MQGISAMRPMIQRPVSTKEEKTSSWEEWTAARTPDQVEWDNRVAQLHSLQAAKEEAHPIVHDENDHLAKSKERKQESWNALREAQEDDRRRLLRDWAEAELWHAASAI